MKILAIHHLDENLVWFKPIINNHFREALFLSSHNGNNGIELATEHQPNIILLDAPLAKINEFNLCKKLKENHLTSSIPILFLGADLEFKNSISDKVELGEHAFLDHPLEENELIEQISFFTKNVNSKPLTHNKKTEVKNTQDQSNYLLQIEQENKELKEALSQQISKNEILDEKIKHHDLLMQKTEKIAKIGYWTLNLETKIVLASEGAKRIYGFTQETITFEDIKKSRLPEYNEIMDEAMANLISGKKPYEVTFKIKRKTDDALLVIHSKADYQKEGKQIFGIISDITEQVQQLEHIEAMDQKWKGVIESTPVAMAINDSNSNITFVNSTFTKVFGYTLSEIPTVKVWFEKAYPDPNYRNIIEKKWYDALESFKKSGIRLPSPEVEVTCKDGSVKSILISNSWLGDSIENNQLIVLYDNTKRRKAQEKQLEYFQVLEGVLNSIDVRVFWKDKNLNYLGCNQNFAKDAGYSSVNEIIGKNDFQMAWNEQAELYQKDDLAVIQSGMPKLNIEEPQSTADVSNITLLTNKIPLLNSNGEVEGVIGTYLDITERKKQDLALAINQMYLQSVLQSTNDGVLAMGLKGEILYFNDKYSELTKLPKSFIEESNEENLLDYITDKIEDGINFRKKIENLHNSIDKINEIARFKNGRVMEYHSQPLVFSKEIIGRVWSIRDITERVISEEKIRQKDIEFQKLSANVSDLIYQFTRRPDGSYFVPIASSGIINIFGCNPEDVIDSFEPIASVIHPEDMEMVINEIEYSAKNLSYFTCEFRVQIPGKEVQWIYSKSNPELLPDGSVTWYGFNTDITSRIKAEEKLLQLSEAVEQSPVTIVITDLAGKIQYANPTFTKTTGYTLEEALGKNPRILKSGETDAKEYKKLWETISNGNKWVGEFHNRDKHGNLYWESATIGPVKNKKGVIKNYMAIKMDITQSKESQIALEESNKKYALVSKATHDSIWDLDIVTGLLNTTENETSESNFVPHFRTKQDWINLIHPEDLPNFLETQKIAFQNTETNYWEFEFRMFNRSGKLMVVNCKGFIVRDEKGNAIRLIAAAQDITERMNHIRAIESQNKQLHEIAWVQSHIVRAPLARIMGLIDLMKDEDKIPEETKELMGYILSSAQEFDEIIKSIIYKSRNMEIGSTN
ncbi:MAG: PAS domain S-box protein [Bacteroidia bacterium]|nr:PAS domain S-box protein [Bacteroidia bacterium]MCF8428247.1 PAS domain S-box protein [Bacteroidia bacterium]